MRDAAYINYLETVVLSLLNERTRTDDIVVDDPLCGAWARDGDLAPYNIREIISRQRK